MLTAVARAQQPEPQDKDGLVQLLKENDLSDWEGNNDARWTLEDGLLRGRSDGKSPAVLILKGRNPGNFELRFEARVKNGAVRIKMRGPGPGPLGTAVEVNANKVEVITNGMPFFVAASNRPDNWKEYRILFCGSHLKLWIDGIPAPYELSASHINETGKLSLHLSDNEVSDISLRQIRINESKSVRSGSCRTPPQ